MPYIIFWILQVLNLHKTSGRLESERHHKYYIWKMVYKCIKTIIPTSSRVVGSIVLVLNSSLIKKLNRFIYKKGIYLFFQALVNRTFAGPIPRIIGISLKGFFVCFVLFSCFVFYLKHAKICNFIFN